jgi:hypothetical protein
VGDRVMRRFGRQFDAIAGLLVETDGRIGEHLRSLAKDESSAAYRDLRLADALITRLDGIAEPENIDRIVVEAGPGQVVIAQDVDRIVAKTRPRRC